MNWYLIIYFLAGLLQDSILTLNWRFINKDRVIPAALTSFAVTIVSMTVLYNILTQLDKERGFVAILVYALGIASGTIVGMKTKIASKD